MNNQLQLETTHAAGAFPHAPCLIPACAEPDRTRATRTAFHASTTDLTMSYQKKKASSTNPTVLLKLLAAFCVLNCASAVAVPTPSEDVVALRLEAPNSPPTIEDVLLQLQDVRQELETRVKAVEERHAAELETRVKAVEERYAAELETIRHEFYEQLSD
eukprot:scaffold56038_cov60-Phaeocystis_antarctica.AAC.1